MTMTVVLVVFVNIKSLATRGFPSPQETDLSYHYSSLWIGYQAFNEYQPHIYYL